MKTIDIELRAANNVGGGNYSGLLADSLDKHSKSVLAKNGGNPITIPKNDKLYNLNKLLE